MPAAEKELDEIPECGAETLKLNNDKMAAEK